MNAQTQAQAHQQSASLNAKRAGGVGYKVVKIVKTWKDTDSLTVLLFAMLDLVSCFEYSSGIHYDDAFTVRQQLRDILDALRARRTSVKQQWAVSELEAVEADLSRDLANWFDANVAEAFAQDLDALFFDVNAATEAPSDDAAVRAELLERAETLLAECAAVRPQIEKRDEDRQARAAAYAESCRMTPEKFQGYLDRISAPEAPVPLASLAYFTAPEAPEPEAPDLNALDYAAIELRAVAQDRLDRPAAPEPLRVDPKILRFASDGSLDPVQFKLTALADAAHACVADPNLYESIVDYHKRKVAEHVANPFTERPEVRTNVLALSSPAVRRDDATDDQLRTLSDALTELDRDDLDGFDKRFSVAAVLAQRGWPDNPAGRVVLEVMRDLESDARRSTTDVLYWTRRRLSAAAADFKAAR